jgi:hypothetical protein
MEYSAKDKRLFLRLGDRVTHLLREEWGEGVVVEERTSIVPGGTCLVRLLFEDGQQRTFNNDLDHEQCCYFFGLRRVLAISLEGVAPGPARTRARRRLPEPALDRVGEVARSARRAPARAAGRRLQARGR